MIYPLTLMFPMQADKWFKPNKEVVKSCWIRVHRSVEEFVFEISLVNLLASFF